MKKTKKKVRGFSITFVSLFIFWLIMSGDFHPLLLSLGVISSALVAYISHDLFYTKTIGAKNRSLEVVRFFAYLPWLIWQIVLANLHVVYLALHPKMPIDPEMVVFKTKLGKDMALVTLANSITLTPGTITVDIQEKEFCIHALSKKVAADLLGGEMEARVAHIFRED